MRLLGEGGGRELEGALVQVLGEAMPLVATAPKKAEEAAVSSGRPLLLHYGERYFKVVPLAAPSPDGASGGEEMKFKAQHAASRIQRSWRRWWVAHKEQRSESKLAEDSSKEAKKEEGEMEDAEATALGSMEEAKEDHKEDSKTEDCEEDAEATRQKGMMEEEEAAMHYSCLFVEEPTSGKEAERRVQEQEAREEGDAQGQGGDESQSAVQAEPQDRSEVAASGSTGGSSHEAAQPQGSAAQPGADADGMQDWGMNCSSDVRSFRSWNDATGSDKQRTTAAVEEQAEKQQSPSAGSSQLAEAPALRKSLSPCPSSSSLPPTPTISHCSSSMSLGLGAARPRRSAAERFALEAEDVQARLLAVYRPPLQDFKATPGMTCPDSFLQGAKECMSEDYHPLIDQVSKSCKNIVRTVIDNVKKARLGLSPVDQALFRSFVAQPGPQQLFALVSFSYDARREKRFGAPASASFYPHLRRVVRDREEESEQALLDLLNDYLCHLRAGLEKLRPVDGPIYCGVPAEASAKLAELLVEGQRIFWPSFTSFTPSLAVAEEAAGAGGIVLKVLSRTARDLSRINELSSAMQGAEAVLLPDTKLVAVAPSESEASTCTMLELREVDEGEEDSGEGSDDMF